MDPSWSWISYFWNTFIPYPLETNLLGVETKIILDLGYSSKTSSISRLPSSKKENEIYRSLFRNFVELNGRQWEREIRSWIIKIENSFSRVSRNFQRDDFIEIGSMKKEKGEVDVTRPTHFSRRVVARWEPGDLGNKIQPEVRRLWILSQATNESN